MRYKLKQFNKDVAYYKRALKRLLSRGETCIISMQLANEKAFFSLAPLSRAIDELGADSSVFVMGKERRVLPVLRKTWKLYNQLKEGKESKATKALHGFIQSVEKKTKSKYFEKLFKQPGLELIAAKKGFRAGDKSIEFRNQWFKRFKWKQLIATNKRILKQGYGLGRALALNSFQKRKTCSCPCRITWTVLRLPIHLP